MAARDEDLAFLRYRQTGRAEFLGQVFDQTAPGLLLVACHLARGAEDHRDQGGGARRARPTLRGFRPSRWPLLPAK